MNPCRPWREQSVARHREKDARLTILKHQQDRAHGNDGAKRDDPAEPRQAGDVERLRQRIVGKELLVRHEAGGDGADDDVNDRADREPAQDAERHVALRIPGLLRRGGDRVESDIREEYNRGALMNAAETVGRKRVIIPHVDVPGSDDDEEGQHGELDRHQDVVGARTLPHAQHQQPGNQRHDHERRDVHENRDACDMRGGLHQPVDFRIRAEQRLSVAVNRPIRKIDPHA